MPRGDGTGPMGMGPRTGRAAGFCAGFDVPGYANPASGGGLEMGFGRGRGFWGCGRGHGRGWRNWFHATGLPGWIRFGGGTSPYQQSAPDVEKEALRQQAQALEAELSQIRQRLSDLEAGNVPR